jgi:type VI secretion system protein ImpK
MRKEIADMVFPVFRDAIDIKERLHANDRSLNFTDSQKRLLARLLAPVTENLRSDVMGDGRSTDGSLSSSSAKVGYRGIRYALASWLDEVFILDTPWQDDWNKSKMETTLYATTERAEEFWRQADRAQNRPTRDTLEVYYLCVMLGFRGEPDPRPANFVEWLVAWRDTVEAQITQGDDREYTPPPPLAITPDVQHKLRGAQFMQKWFMIAIIAALAFIPLVFLYLNPGR